MCLEPGNVKTTAAFLLASSATLATASMGEAIDFSSYASSCAQVVIIVPATASHSSFESLSHDLNNICVRDNY